MGRDVEWSPVGLQVQGHLRLTELEEVERPSAAGPTSPLTSIPHFQVFKSG